MFPLQSGKNIILDVVLFDLENFYTGLVGIAPNNDSIAVR